MKILKIIASVLFALILIWSAGLCAFSAYALNIKPQAPTQKTDAIIVLTGGKNRIEEGLQLYADEAAVQLFITGVHENVDMPQIVAMWSGDKPLPACCITLGHKARSTAQNAIEVRDWLNTTGYKSIRLVTGNYHMPRAMLELSHALPDIEIIRHPVEQSDLKVNQVLLRRLLISEYHKSIFRFISLGLGIKGEPYGW